jgi:4-methyl-5(b-hydroxyethyl)-thiazole monophosphate biosynthesis
MNVKKVYVFLAEGFEEVEALLPVDLLRRAGVEAEMVSVTGNRMVKSSHSVKIEADRLYEEIKVKEADMLVLPGGMPGTRNLAAHTGLCEALKSFHKEGKPVAAICAAPSVLGANGILEGKRATCYPGFEGELKGAKVVAEPSVTDGNVITGKGAGAATEFALALVEKLISKEKALEIKAQIQFSH